jgi:hypothetical protein
VYKLSKITVFGGIPERKVVPAIPRTIFHPSRAALCRYLQYNMASQQSSNGGGGGGGGAPRPLQMGAKGAYIVRLLMVGDSSCGKTSLVLRFDQNVFSTKFVTTIGVDYRDKMVKVSLRFIYYESNLLFMWRWLIPLGNVKVS